ncbi:methyl-accepting chemotaxis protein [Maridesulfovibrio zosterae]|uniref:methyl-accepting chemotaxis protein n=1 Tax=Maridesulfovibrio zosterae TaxID=82171 RepID=UPI000416EF31|nr:methyl-accepting chemotaxis protein [Maridesulfovibrio zosterae]
MIKSISSAISATAAFLVVASIGGIVFLVVSMTNSSVMEIEKRNMTQMGNQLADNADMYALDIKHTLQALASDSDFQKALTDDSNLDVAQDKIKKMIAPFPSYNALYCFDSKGVIRVGIKQDGASLIGLDLAKRKYVKDIFKGKESVFSDIIKSRSGGETILAVAVPIKDDSGKIVGGMAAGIDWDIFSHELLSKVTINKSGYPLIVDGRGRIIAHKLSKEFILKDYSSQSFVREASSKKNGFVHYEWDGADKMLYFQHVKETGWIIFLTVNKSEIESTATQLRNVIVAVGFVVALIFIISLVLSVRSMILKPIQNIRLFTSRIADGDFSAELNGKFKYEIEELAGDISQTVSVLKNKLGFSNGVLKGITSPFVVVDVDETIVMCNKALVDFVGEKTSVDSFIGKKLGALVYNDPSKKTLSAKAMSEGAPILNVRANLEDRNGVMKTGFFSASPLFDLDNNLIGAFSTVNDITEVYQQQEEIKAQAEKVEVAAKQANGIATQVSSAAAELFAQIEESTSGANTQRNLTSEAAAAMEQMSASVVEVARSAEHAAELADESRERALSGKDVVAKVISMMDQVREKTSILSQDMTSLGKHADGIGSIMTVISDIADQTNLLALNAAIEAARAGDAGRGFAVVADEVRKLAEKTVHATNEVGGYIKSIQDATGKSVINTEQTTEVVEQASDFAAQSGEALQEIVSMVRETTDQVRSIATASEEQSAVSAQIAQSAEQVNSIAVETASTMEQSSNAVADLSRLADELEELMSSMIQKS